MVDKKGNILVLTLIFLTFVVVGVSGFLIWQNKSQPKRPLTWENCIKTPGAINQLSYPGVCRLPDGRQVAQPLTDEEKKKLQPPCEIEKEYVDSAISPITCQCPAGYMLVGSGTAWGQCPKLEMQDCPAQIKHCEQINVKNPPP